MLEDLWRWADPDGQQRTVRLDELRAALAGGLIAPNTPVWRTGWKAWQPAHDVPELTSASVGGFNGVVLNIPPPPLEMVAVQQQYELASGSIVPGPVEKPPTATEPPPPPRFVPLPTKSQSLPPSSGSLRTQLGGSPYVPAADGSSPVVPPAPPSSAPSPFAPAEISMPTTFGVPPPPDVVALAQAKHSAPPPVPSARRQPVPVAEAPASAIEEISASILLESTSSHDLSGSSNGAPGGGGGPGTRPGSRDSLPVDKASIGLPQRPDPSVYVRRFVADVRAVTKGRAPKSVGLFAGVAGGAVLLLFLFVAGLVSAFSGPAKPDELAGAASASATPARLAPSAVAVVAPLATVPPPPIDELSATPSFGDCTLAGEARTIASRAQIASAIEAQALGGGVALGFAATPKDAVATLLDPASLQPSTTVRTRPSGGDARRVTPLFVGNRLTAVPDVDRKGDRMSPRRIAATGALVDVGFADGAIVWSPHGRDSIAKIFSVDGDGPVEALRAIALVDRKGIALAFRRGNAIYAGVAKGASVLEPDGELSKMAGLGQVGSPAIAQSGDHVIVAWADRAAGEDDWSLRWTKFRVGQTAAEPTVFKAPEGGLGGHMMSPSLASLGDGRFLLAWTEGPVSGHQVRAVTIGADGAPAGKALSISASGVNAGQPAAVVGPDGRGAIAFLGAKGKLLEVQATPIACPPH